MKKEICNIAAEILLDIKCVNFSPKKLFKLTSGKESPVYCDCRRIISFPKERKQLINFGIRQIKQKFDIKKIDSVAGGETAGIPFASFVAENLNLPMIYIRKEKKKFGRNSQIEGIIRKSEKVLLVEDLMTDGGSKLNFLDAVNRTGAKTKAIFVIFNYGIIKEHFSFRKENIDVISLTSWKFILEVAFKKKILNINEIKVIEKFLVDLGVKN